MRCSLPEDGSMPASKTWCFSVYVSVTRWIMSKTLSPWFLCLYKKCSFKAKEKVANANQITETSHWSWSLPPLISYLPPMIYIHTQFAYLIIDKIYLLKWYLPFWRRNKRIVCFVMWGRVVSPETQLRFGRKNAILRQFLLPRILISTHLTPLPW